MYYCCYIFLSLCCYIFVVITVLNIGLNHAVVLLSEKSSGGKIIGNHPSGKGNILGKSGAEANPIIDWILYFCFLTNDNIIHPPIEDPINI